MQGPEGAPERAARHLGADRAPPLPSLCVPQEVAKPDVFWYSAPTQIELPFNIMGLLAFEVCAAAAAAAGALVAGSSALHAPPAAMAAASSPRAHLGSGARCSASWSMPGTGSTLNPPARSSSPCTLWS